jgi:hypothetical protein
MKNERKLSHAYIYTNGTLVEVFHERRSGMTIGQTVDVTRGFCEVQISKITDENRELIEAGRIVLNSNTDSMLTLMRGGTVYADLSSIHGGSRMTAGLGLLVEFMKVVTAKGLKFWWNSIPDTLSGPFAVQEIAADYSASFCDVVLGSYLEGRTVCKVKDLRKTV